MGWWSWQAGEGRCGGLEMISDSGLSFHSVIIFLYLFTLLSACSQRPASPVYGDARGESSGQVKEWASHSVAKRLIWQARRDSNPQPPDLESGALPIELRTSSLRYCAHRCRRDLDHLMTSATTPDPTVRPPSRIAKRIPWCMAMGAINSTSTSTLSPGITISTLSGNLMDPVTSVVLK